MRSIYITILLFLAAITVQAQQVDWVRTNADSWMRGDLMGNAYIIRIPGPGQHSYIIEKITNRQAGEWTIQLPEYLAVGDMAVDGKGNVYVTGSFTSNIALNGDTLPNRGGSDMLIAKFNSNGELSWYRHEGGSRHEQALGIKAGVSGEVYVTGSFTDSTRFAGHSYTGDMNDNFFLASYDADGAVRWVRHAGNNTGTGHASGYKLSLNENGDVFVLGHVSENCIDFPDTSICGKWVEIIIKYDSNGKYHWVRFSSGDYATTDDIAADKEGNVFTCGSTDYPYSKAFLKKYDQKGNVVRHTIYDTDQGYYGDKGEALAIDGNNTLHFSYTGGLWQENGWSLADKQFFVHSMFVDAGGNLYINGFGKTDSASIDDIHIGKEHFIAKIGTNPIPTGIKEKASKEITVAPNPTNGQVKITMPGGRTAAQVSVFDMTGNTVHTSVHSMNKGLITLDLQQQPEGIYFVEVIHDHKREVKKLVKH